MEKVARIIDVKQNRIIGKLYKSDNGLLAKPEVEGDSDLPLTYFYKNKLHSKLDIAIELGVLDDLEIDQELIDNLAHIFGQSLEVVTVG